MPSPLRPLLLLIAAGPALLSGQSPDSTKRLRDLAVTVTRTPEGLAGLGASVTVLDSLALRRGRVAAGLDEALAFVPGVITGNRWNYSVDQRLTIRGFGARANFGIRGIKVILDGVPQTLPDGQSTLTNLDLALVERAEVLRGAASALYGNASGGVLSFTTRVVPQAPWHVETRGEAGTFGTFKGQLVAAARTGQFGGTVALSQFTTDGFRQHAVADLRRLSLGANWFPSGSTVVTFRFAAADDPKAENPGALTFDEVAIRRDSAAANNIRRGADKRVTQQQAAIGVRHQGKQWQFEATAWGLARLLDNPLAAPPPPPLSAVSGTWVGIDRQAGGARAVATTTLGTLRVTTGLDVQTMDDERENQRSLSGVPTGELLLDQREEVTEVGPFAQLIWPARENITLRAGVRHDATRFTVTDAFLSDGDASGSRTLDAWSGNVGVTLHWSAGMSSWASIASAFETPTTTELANRPAGDGGFNPDLGPQRSVSEEVGVRGERGQLRFEAALYHTTTTDAIVPWRELGGRAYYRNAGKTRTLGGELGGTLALGRGLSVLGSWTWTDAIFTDYRVQDGAITDTLDGRTLAGIPAQVLRFGLRGEIGKGFTIDLDHAFSSSQFADDRNTLRVEGWGTGVTGVRLAWQGELGHATATPFIAATNVFGREVVGSVTINGANGRVLEPAAGRALYLGLTIGVDGNYPR